MKKYNFETLAIHSGQTVNPATMSRGVEIARTSAFLFRDAKHASDLFGLRELGNIYSRLTNPTNAILEDRITALENGAATIVLASGTSAIHYTIINLASHGDDIVSSSKLYGGTFTMFDAILPQFGIKCNFVDSLDAKDFDNAVTEQTKLIYVECMSNPTLDVFDIEAIAKVAYKHKIPLVVDATFTTPFHLRAIDHGADIVINSLTKWIGGHGTAIGGSVTDAGKFDYKSKKFPLYSEPDKNYHGMRWAYDLPDSFSKICFALRLRTVPLRNLGACLTPDNAWIFLQGLETLSVRMPRHSENALAVAKYLSKHAKVEWIRYPGLKNDPAYTTAKKYMKNGFGGMVVFGIKGGLKAGQKFIEKVELFSHLANVGDAKSLALHPASTSHSQLNESQMKKAGLQVELVRLSIGLEHIDDVIADIENALK